ncbi:MAG TPA: MAC/perforin domain-containing protein [Herpetosiphonaceae bacterium]
MRTAEGVPYLSQANYVGQGFDIYGAYNITTSRTQALFDPEKAGTHQFDFLGKTYALPSYIDGTVNTESRYLEETVHTRDEFQNVIASHAKVHGSYGAFSGHMEAAYGHQFTRSSEYDYSFWSFFARLATLSIKVDTKYLTDYFAQRISGLPRTVNDSNLIEFEDFFNDFGAYFVSEVHLGGELDYYVSVSKESSLSKTTISSMVNIEHRGLFVSGGISADIKKSQDWQSYSSSRQVRIVATGGDPAVLTQLVGLNPNDPSAASVVAFNQWANTMEHYPAFADFHLRGIWELCGDRRAVVEQAFHVYGPKMRPRLNVEVSTNSVPLIVLGNQIKPPQPPNYNLGYQMVILDRTNITPEGVVLDKYYVPDAPHGYDNIKQMYNRMYADIVQGGYNKINYVLILASFGMIWKGQPTSEFYGLLRTAGGGSKLLQWMNEGISMYGNTTYILVGIFGLGPDTGVESLTYTVEDVPLNDELQVFFYGQRGTDLYTLGAG